MTLRIARKIRLDRQDQIPQHFPQQIPQHLGATVTAQIIAIPDRHAVVVDPIQAPNHINQAPRPSLGQRIEEAVLVALAIAATCAFWGVHLFNLFLWLWE